MWMTDGKCRERPIGQRDENKSASKSMLSSPAIDLYIIHDICFQRYTRLMIIDWTGEFDRWWSNIEKLQNRDQASRQIAIIMGAQLEYLQGLEHSPTDDLPELRRIAQSKRYQLWRLSHPWRDGIALRLIVWFPNFQTDLAVILMGVNKAKMGNVFYDGVGTRSDYLIDQYIREGEDR